MEVGGKKFNIEKKSYIVGILNFTPDSFYDGGKWNSIDSALKHCEEMVCDGASIIDIGGESTRPSHDVISVDEEINRIGEIVSQVRRRFDIPLSLDTRKKEVAASGIKAGADLINDVSGLEYSPEMAELIATTNVSCCLSHWRQPIDDLNFFDRFVKEIEDMLESAFSSGISKSKICLDPGIGFGKTTKQNLEIVGRLDELKQFNLPILLGTSNKSFIGNVLNLDIHNRLEGTLATTAVAAMNGVAFIRVHDVKSNFRVVKMIEAIKNFNY